MPEVSSILEGSIVDKKLKDRVYFHVISTFLEHHGDSLDTSYKNWYRIFRNLINNSVIDSQESYERAIKGINEQIEHTSDLLEYLAEGNRINGFSIDQVDEEIEKAKLITADDSYRDIIEVAEKHRYFDGQIRSCFYFDANDLPSRKIDIISTYWNKISKMFTETKPKEGLLMRVALLSLGDYTISTVSNYKTLCQDNPNEYSGSAPSLKSLFSSRNEYVKKLLDELDMTKPLDVEYRRIIQENISNIAPQEWRYAFIAYYEIMFSKMTPSQYRMKSPFWLNRSEEMLLIPNKSSSARNYDIHLIALEEKLKELGIQSYYESEKGIESTNRILYVNDVYEVRFRGNHFSLNLIGGEEAEEEHFDPTLSFLDIAEYLNNKLHY